MLAYYFLIGTPMLYAMWHTVHSNRSPLEQKERARDRNAFAVLIFFFIFTLMLSLRHVSVGADTEQYRHLFAKLAYAQTFPEGYVKNREYGFYYLSYLLAHILPSFQWYLGFVSLFSVLPLAYFYYKNTKLPYLSVIMFATVAPLSMYFSGLRQVTAMAFAVPVWYCAKRKKPIQFLLTIGIAMLFHSSAFILLPCYPLYRAKITRKWLPFVIPGMLLIYIFNRQIFSFLMKYVYKGYGTLSETGAYEVLLLLVLFAVLSFVVTREETLDPDTVALRNFLLLSVALQCFAPINQWAMRLNYYYLIFIPVLITRVLKRCSKNMRVPARAAQIVLTVFFTLYFFYRVYRGADSLHIYPYIPFWT